MHFRTKCIAIYSIALTSLITLPAFAQQHKDVSAITSMERNERDQTPSSITFAANAGFKIPDAPQLFNQYLGLNAAYDELRFRVADMASADVKISRYDQYFKGIKVEHGNYIVASRHDLISYMSGNFYKTDPAVNVTAQLTESSALAKATGFIGATKYMWSDADGVKYLKQENAALNAANQPRGELVLLEDYYSGEEPDGHLHLAYRFDIYATQPVSRQDIYVDAVTGKILFSNATIKHITGNGPSLYSGNVHFDTRGDGTTYFLKDSTRGKGVNTYSLGGGTNVSGAVNITSTDTVWATNVGLDAHWGAQRVYDYWKLKRGRLSYNGLDSTLNSYVDYDVNYNNAFWSGSAMFYGNGSGRRGGGLDPLVALDICAHEIGHGVCGTTAQLIYNRESGGMNEGFSDIWGAVIENYADPHEIDATPKSNWDIGEEISASPLRSMSQPKLHGDPDTYKGINWKYATSNCIPNSNTNDQCGVHSNSGVLNKWFYLLTMGGSGTNDVGNGYGVSGLGFDTAAQIAYGTELSLTSTANYAAARTAAINYATTQFGACSRAVEMVTRAWYAVNVGTGYTACTPMISFNGPAFSTTEDAAMNSCTASRVVNIPVTLNGGPAPAGGNAVVKVNITGGTAVSGIDYRLDVDSVIFPSGSNAVQYIALTVLDNGNVLDTNRYLDMTLTLKPNGSNAAFASVLTGTRVIINNNDVSPVIGSTIAALPTVGNIITSGLKATTTTPFMGNATQARVQYLISAAELSAANVKPNTDITKIAFYVTSKVSVNAFAGFTVKLANTSLDEFTTGFATGFTQVYSDSLKTVAGWNTLGFSNNFRWDGSSNLAVEICFTNLSRSTANDVVLGNATGLSKVAYMSNNFSTGGCGLAFSASNLSDTRPTMRFTQVAPASLIATNPGATRSWHVRANDRVYFYAEPDTGLIAGIWNTNQEPGCVTAAISAAGNGFVPSVIPGYRRSVKEITITPAVQGGDTISNSVIFYMNDTELNNTDPSILQLLKTTSPTDAGINVANMQVVTVPVRTAGVDHKSFRGTFTGFGRYFLVDTTANLAVNSLNRTDMIRVNNNPFVNDVIVSCNMQKAASAMIRLYDMTGKLLYNKPLELQSGIYQFQIPTAGLNLAPGHYVLSIVTASGVFTQKLLKQ